MRRLTDAQVEAVRQRIAAGEPGDAYDTPARFEAPMGEWLGNLLGFALGLRLQGALPNPTGITSKDRFVAQGLEGKIALATTLGDAVVMAHHCAARRWAVYATMVQR